MAYDSLDGHQLERLVFNALAKQVVFALAIMLWKGFR
jgi:hypothetical protein